MSLSDLGTRVSSKGLSSKGRYPIKPNHPATSEHVFSAQELEFLKAIEAFKLATGKKFPTWTEVLSVLLRLGYTKPGVLDILGPTLAE